jgi:ribonuclease HI
MKILFTDGGCSGNEQRDPKRRQMIAVVTDENGSILVEKTREGGSNNIAELLAVKEAMAWAVDNEHDQIEIRTDSKNNLAWVLGTNVGKKINDRDAVLALKSSIDSLKRTVKIKLVLIPRSRNKAGHYIENKRPL